MNKHLAHVKAQAGATLVEVLVAIALAGILLPVLATALVTANAGRPATTQQLQASSLLREAMEAVRVRREAGWANIATNGTYFPAISGSTWTLTAGTQTANGFTRQIVISSVQRDIAGTIVASGGTTDPSTKKVVATVSWTTPYNSSVSSEAYFTRWQNHATWSETEQAVFDSYTAAINTEVTNTAGGEFQLNSDGTPNWASPVVVDSYNVSGTQDALDIYTSGDYAYLSDGTTLSIFNIANPANITLTSTYNAGATVNHVFVSGSYAYLSTASDTYELRIVNISNPALPTTAASVNLAGTANAQVTSVDGAYAYVGRVASTTTSSFEFQVVDVTNPNAPVVRGGIDYNTGTVNSIKLVGSYAYLATTIDTQEVISVNVTNKTTPTTTASYNAPGTADATDLGTYAAMANYMFVSSLTNASGAETYALNISNPASLTLAGSYEVGGSVNGITVLNGRAFLATAITNRQVIILNVALNGGLSLLANRSLSGSANDVKASENYTYVASTSNTEELIVVGPTFSGNFASSGTYESDTFDAGSAAAFNYLAFTISEPAGTNVQFQIATNNDAVTWNFVGPDGTTATFFTGPGAIHLGQASGRYVRYKAYLTGGTSTPVVSDVTVNYSP